MADKAFMAYRALRRHARPCSFVLRAGGTHWGDTEVVPPELDEFWKSLAARNWPHRDQLPLWQRHSWDTQLRRGENYDEKWEYVLQNPVRAGLVARTEDWRYQGELNILRW